MPENPKVMFKRGSQASLNTLIKGSGDRFVEGSFYLTNDTNRLYVAQSATNLVELNKSITVVPSISDLPTTGVEVGQFYYIAGTNIHQDTSTNGGANGNILAVVTSCDADGTNPHWTQVNPDTNTDHNDNDHVVGFSIVKNTSQSNTSQLVYDWTIQQDDIDGTPLTDLTGSFTIASADISALAGASVGVSSSAVSNNSTTISTVGTGVSNANFTVTGGSNVTLSGNADALTISATDTTYRTLVDTSEKAFAIETTGGTAVGEIDFVNGTAINVGMTTNAGNTDATVTISHADVTRSADSTTNSGQKSGGAAITYVTGITSNSQGHITAVEKETINLPVQTSYSITDVEAGNDGKIHVELNGTDFESDADLYYVVNGTNVYNQGTIDFYTKNEIDNLINTINGMTYKGAIPNGGLPSTGVKVGDTYVVATDGTYGGHAAKAGDLLIAQGTETNGIITSNLTWDLIESGNEFDSQYDLSVANNVISLTSNIAGSTADEVEIIGGNKITATTSNGAITIDHDTQSVTGGASSNAGNQNLVYGQTVNVVNGVKADSYGHVTEIYTSTLTMPSAPANTTESLNVTASSNTHGNGVISLDEDGVGGANKGEITFANGNLTVAQVTQGASSNVGTVTINHAAIATNSNSTVSDLVINPGPTNPGANVITGLTADGYGHITGYTVSNLRLPDAALGELGGDISAVANATNKASIAFTLGKNSVDLTRTGADVPEFTLSSSSLQVAVTPATASTPADVAVDIVWGTF